MEHERQKRLKRRALLAAAAAGVLLASAGAAVVTACCVLLGGWGALAAAATAEACFYACYRRRYELLNAQPAMHEPVGDHDGLQVFRRFLAHSAGRRSTVDITNFVQSWFLGADISQIKRENMVELVAYAFWYRSVAAMEAAGLGLLLQTCIADIEAIWGRKLAPGYNAEIRFMGHLWEPLRCFYKPLAFYAATEALTLMSWAMLVWGYGFEMGSLPCGYVYFTLNMPKRVKQQQQHSSSSAAGSSATTAAAATAAATPLPMVFLHGVGLGVLPYMLFIGSLAAEMSLPSTASATASAPAPQRQPLLLLDHAHVSLRLLWSLFSTRKRPAAAATATPGAAAEAVSRAEAAAHLPTVCGVASRVLQLLDMHGFQQAMLVGHSYGTLVVSRLLKPGFKDAAGRESRSRVAACALIDPVCCGMYHPNLVFSFVYRLPAFCTAKGLLGMLRSVNRKSLREATLWLVSRDLHCASAFCRNFFWSTMNLWPEELALTSNSGNSSPIRQGLPAGMSSIPEAMAAEQACGGSSGDTAASAGCLPRSLVVLHGSDVLIDTRALMVTLTEMGVEAAAQPGTSLAEAYKCASESGTNSTNSSSSRGARRTSSIVAGLQRPSAVSAEELASLAQRRIIQPVGHGGHALHVAGGAVKLLYRHDCEHAEFLLDLPWQDTILKQVMAVAAAAAASSLQQLTPQQPQQAIAQLPPLPMANVQASPASAAVAAAVALQRLPAGSRVLLRDDSASAQQLMSSLCGFWKDDGGSNGDYGTFKSPGGTKPLIRRTATVLAEQLADQACLSGSMAAPAPGQAMAEVSHRGSSAAAKGASSQMIRRAVTWNTAWRIAGSGDSTMSGSVMAC